MSSATERGVAGRLGEEVQNVMEGPDLKRDKIYENLKGSPAAATLESASETIGKLTLLDLEVINGIVAGYSNREIASEMFTTEISVKHQLSGIFDRLEVSGRLELALFAIQRWLRPETELAPAAADDGGEKTAYSSQAEATVPSP